MLLRRFTEVFARIINSIGTFNTPSVTHSTYTSYRDPTEWEKIYVGVESGKVVSAPSWNPYLLGKSFDLISQWVLREGGEIHAISPVGWHTCVDEPNLPCGACECVDDPKHPMGYVLTVKIYRRKLIEFLDGDRHGAVNREKIGTVHYSEGPPRPAPTPVELRAQADALTAAWDKICERIGKKKSA